MDIMRDLVGGGGGRSCAADGTATVVNPISSLVNTMVRGNDMMASMRSGEEICGPMPQGSGYKPSSLELEMARGTEWMSSHPPGQMQQPVQFGIVHPTQAGLRHPLSLQNDTTLVLSERKSDSWAREFPGLNAPGIVAPPPMQDIHPHTMPLAWKQACLERAQISDGGRPFMPHSTSAVGPAWMVPAMPCTDGYFPSVPPHSCPFSSLAFFRRPTHHMVGYRSEYDAIQGPQQNIACHEARIQQLEGGHGQAEENANAVNDTWNAGYLANAWAKRDGFEGHVARRLDDSSSTVGPGNSSNAPSDHLELYQEMELRMEAAWEAALRGEGGGSLDPQEEAESIWNKDRIPLEDIYYSMMPDLSETTRPGLASQEYNFAEDNEYLGASNPMEAGMDAFVRGDIATALLCFEAEIQQSPSNSEAWRMLGQCHAENDQDRRAIECLERASEHDPYNLNALLNLGVSYVNELDSGNALHNLKGWIQHNPKYSELKAEVDYYSDGSLMDEVMQLMLKAEQRNPDDVDVKIVLGVLYNVSRNYECAAEAFKSALAMAPQNHSIWNKLGATLANFNRSHEAIEAYREVLSKRPMYVRGWLNLGISLANLEKNEQAAKCYIRALCLNPEACHIWTYVRIAFTSMKRHDLAQVAASEDVEALRKQYPHAFDVEVPHQNFIREVFSM